MAVSNGNGHSARTLNHEVLRDEASQITSVVSRIAEMTDQVSEDADARACLELLYKYGYLDDARAYLCRVAPDEVAEEWIEWAEGAGIDVIGDLNDLRPVRPPEGEKWENPDRPGPRDMVDAALDAIEALLIEASGDPEPFLAQSKKLARMARRLRHS